MRLLDRGHGSLQWKKSRLLALRIAVTFYLASTLLISMCSGTVAKKNQLAMSVKLVRRQVVDKQNSFTQEHFVLIDRKVPGSSRGLIALHKQG